MESYSRRPRIFRNIDEATWDNWHWQQQNAVRDLTRLRLMLPWLSEEEGVRLDKWLEKGFRFQITPYTAALIGRGDGHTGNGSMVSDPVWRQVFPWFELETDMEPLALVGKPQVGPDEYSPASENWENPDEQISPIAIHKYDNRALVISCDACLGYCVFCFRSLQCSAAKEGHGGLAHWDETVRAVGERPEIEEVILSGGDPLLLSNEVLERMLADLRKIPHIKAIRIHTRAWFYNPFRFDDELCSILRKYRVTEMGVHTVHPVEITEEFKEAVRRVREKGGVGLLMCDTPLVRGINDSTDVLRELFMGLYLAGVKPYYLSHNMPNIPGAAAQRTTVREGLKLWKGLKRHISNPAMPEYVICHNEGKKTVPECEEGDADFQYIRRSDGLPVVRFRNWRGKWVEYLDGCDIG